MSISTKFETFCSNIRMDQNVVDKVTYRFKTITNRLNKDFYCLDSYRNSLYVGSYGRGTAIHVSDIDMLFILPIQYYRKYKRYVTNGQSQLLQEVKRSICKSYPETKLKGDGQVIVIEFTNNIIFEILPCFLNGDGLSYTYPDTHNGGTWKVTKPKEEKDAINELNNSTNNNLKRLCRMIRAWEDKCNVKMGGLLVDTMASNFLKTWEYKDKSYSHYHLMTRDFFYYLSTKNDKQFFWCAVGSGQQLKKKGLFSIKAKKAYNDALEAIICERMGNDWSANVKWREIYGSRFKN